MIWAALVSGCGALSTVLLVFFGLRGREGLSALDWDATVTATVLTALVSFIGLVVLVAKIRASERKRP